MKHKNQECWEDADGVAYSLPDWVEPLSGLRTASPASKMTPRPLNPRAETLLRAAYDLLKRADRASYVVETLSIQSFYDGADCDGKCLMEDIAHFLKLTDDTDPIPLQEGGE